MRLVTTLGLCGALSLALATPAEAAPKGTSCGNAFELSAISDFGPGFQTFLQGVDRNDDDLVCAKPLPEALPFPNINFVDNVARR